MRTSPCRFCTGRASACHDRCKQYLNWKKANFPDKSAKEIIEEYIHKEITKKKRRKWKW